MSKVRKNPLLEGLSGKLGETHAYRKIQGKMYMVTLPEKGKPLREDQKVFITKFQRAASYAKAAVKIDEVRATYATGITQKKQNAYTVALSDVLNPPKVNEIKASDYNGQAGDEIRVDATDDFRVVRVRVTIYDADGNKLEVGEAFQDLKHSHLWRYSATAPNPAVKGSRISVTAFDMADNETTQELTL